MHHINDYRDVSFQIFVISENFASIYLKMFFEI